MSLQTADSFTDYMPKDKWVRIMGIPLLAVLIVSIFYRKNLTSGWLIGGATTLHSMLYTFCFWEGSRFIIKQFRIRYQRYTDSIKRLIGQSIAIILFVLITSYILYNLSYWYTPKEFWSPDHTFWRNFQISLSITLSVAAFYEAEYFFSRWKAALTEGERLKRAHTESQLESLKNQVNPHFLFNSLNTLSSIIPKEPEIAVDFVQKLSKVYRYILEVNAASIISLKEELDFVDAYTFLLKTRHGKRLSIQLEIPEVYLPAMIAPLSLQILLENAVKHNVVSRQKPLAIRVFIQNEYLWVENPLQRKKVLQPSTGLGLANIKNRYQLLGEEEVVIIEQNDVFRVGLPLILSTNL